MVISAMDKLRDSIDRTTDHEQSLFRHHNVSSLFRGLGLTPDQIRGARAQVAAAGIIYNAPVTYHVTAANNETLRRLEEQIEKRGRSRAATRGG